MTDANSVWLNVARRHLTDWQGLAGIRNTPRLPAPPLILLPFGCGKATPLEIDVSRFE